MPASHRVLMTVLTLACAPAHAEQGKHLFILSGQSNMVGLKPGTSFTPAVEKEFGKERVIVVHDAQSGCPIRNWVKDWKPAPGKNLKGGKDGLHYDASGYAKLGERFAEAAIKLIKKSAASSAR